MNFGVEMWMCVWFILAICSQFTECYQVEVKTDENYESLPLVVCEGYQYYTAIPCWHSHTKTELPLWVKWNRNDTLIDISQDIATPACQEGNEEGNYISGAGMDKTFFLLLPSSVLMMENDGDRYGCFRPKEKMATIEYRGDEGRDEYTVVIRVLPKEQCLEGQPRITTDITTTQTTPSHGITTDITKRPTLIVLTTTNSLSSPVNNAQKSGQSPAYSTNISTHMLMFAIVLAFLMFVHHDRGIVHHAQRD